MKKTIIVVILVFVLAFSMIGCANKIIEENQEKNVADTEATAEQQTLIEQDNIKEKQLMTQKNNNEIPDSTEEYVHVYSTNASRARSCETFAELKDNSSFIFTGKCISSEPIFQNETLYTLSQVQVENVYKGDLLQGDIAYLIEMGGRSTFGTYEKECNLERKAFEPEIDRLPSDTKISVGINGYYPMRKDEQVLLFAGDTSGFLKDGPAQLLDVICAWDGKFILQEDGSYKKPASSEEDKLAFSDNSLVISIEELNEIK